MLNGSHTRLAFPTNIRNPLWITEYQAGQAVNKDALSAFCFTALRRGGEKPWVGAAAPQHSPQGHTVEHLLHVPRGLSNPRQGPVALEKSVELRLNQTFKQRWQWSEEITKLSI